MNCPLSPQFFSKLRYSHSSHIRREINKIWKIDRRNIKKHIRSLIYKDWKIREVRKETTEWHRAFLYAEERNKYRGYQLDKAQITSDIQEGKVRVTEGKILLDVPCWLSLASIAFQDAVEKESPNHLFLKELFRLYITSHSPTAEIQEEKSITLFGEPVRLDLLCENVPGKHIVGEAGGVQLWKVMVLLHSGYEVYVFPHWTNNKTNPFSRKKLDYTYFHFQRPL